ncbi:unnamed protein product [Cylicocyclus nassatus]|uniref:Uncharacterized protein n=1 Tax=Cylicocyclus nassatus TaxID=53992 RepID=A0AA36M7P9_CYLNA|nr:unnamed protein product [Cylicocyclus nassatus]
MMPNLPGALYLLQQPNTGNPSGRRRDYDLHAQRYPATMEQSKKGKHPVMRYAIPGSNGLTWIIYAVKHAQH